MVEVQTALAPLMASGIPVYAGAWRPTTESQVPPDQYIVYSTTTSENFAADDTVLEHRTFVYMELWSQSDPSETIEDVRELMYAAGFGMKEESDKGYNQPSYDYHTKNYNMSWTWTYNKEVSYGCGN